MMDTLNKSQKKILIAVSVVLVVSAGVWATSAIVGGESKDDSPDVLANLPPMENREQVRAFMRSEQTTDEQRQALMRQFREEREGEMDARVNEYFEVSEEERVVVLDKHIDEMRERWEERQKRREEREEARAEEGREEEDREEAERRREEWRNRRASATRQERKERSESRDADKQGRRMAYFTAMRSRMESRGISPPGGGRGGGGGGGRGGFGGGRGPR